jgi:SAM-dependent methyltransferase
MSDRHPFFAFVYPIVARLGERGELGARRRRLLVGARGHVVEIGAGSGTNFRHYPDGVDVIATDVEPGLLRRARRAAAQTTAVTVQPASADALPFPDASADTVVSTLVLCSVPDQAAALAEIRRVLRPGGALLFLEHVRSDDPVLASKQDRGEPRHVRFGAGCHPNRDTVAAITAAGLSIDAIERFRLPGTKITSPAVSGVARFALDLQEGR